MIYVLFVQLVVLKSLSYCSVVIFTIPELISIYYQNMIILINLKWFVLRMMVVVMAADEELQLSVLKCGLITVN